MKTSTTTYGQLDKVLRSLGFSCRLVTDDPPPTRVYRHPEAGALILLPALPESDQVFEFQPRKPGWTISASLIPQQ